MVFDIQSSQKPWVNLPHAIDKQFEGKEPIFESEFAKLARKRKTLITHTAPQETFHQAIRPILIVGQIFAMMPLRGITSPNASSLKFTILDPRFPYAIIVIFTAGTMACFTLYWVVCNNVEFFRMEPLLWFSCNTFFMCIFILVAKRWPSIMVYWEKLEKEVTISNLKRCNEMKKNIYTASSVILSLALIEHLLSIGNGIKNAHKCKNISGILEGYFRFAYPAYFYTFGYNIIGGICLELLNCYCVFTWNFMDNFVIALSLGLAAQFQYFNDNLNHYRRVAVSDEFWSEQRFYYTKLVELMNLIDNKLTIITMLSFSNNLYYICLQLFYSFEPSDSIVQSIYFWYSLIFLIGRTLAVSFCAAKVHDESRKPIEVLRLVPPNVYTKEAKRFLEQVTNTTVALSGMKFFHVTRKFILKVAGTVVTYELVLVQLQRSPESDMDLCFR